MAYYNEADLAPTEANVARLIEAGFERKDGYWYPPRRPGARRGGRRSKFDLRNALKTLSIINREKQNAPSV